MYQRSLSKKVVFPFDSIVFEKRSDKNYNSSTESNQHSRSPLADVVSLRDAFPPEYMHLVCLGLVRRLIQCYLTTCHGLFPCKLTDNMKSLLDTRVHKFRNVLLAEFNRKMRSFSNHVYFKAIEFRTILLYTGPVLFQGILPREYFEHFLLLHFSMFIFVSNKFQHFYPQAKACLQRFLLQMSTLFHQSEYTFNAHIVSHLPEFVDMYGPVDNFSAFPIENYLYVLKKRIKSGSFVFSQAINAVHLIREIYVATLSPSLRYSTTYPDNCFIVLHNDVPTPLIVENVSKGDSILLSGTLLKFKSNLYNYPYDSSVIGIGKYVCTNIFVSEVHPLSKCIMFRTDSCFITIPFTKC